MGNEALHRATNRRAGRSTLNRDIEHDTTVTTGINTNTNTEQLNDQTSSNKSHKRMDKLRRSLTFRRKKNKNKNQQLHGSSSNLNNSPIQTQQQAQNSTNTPPPTTTYNIDPNKPTSWQDDERKVREGTCSFHVKYLGCIEVADSRGMHVCEQAIDKLINTKKKPIKAILYVSGDSLRVVDESNKQLLLDQTIEKVSFCAPDRYHENGFAYICRDGTTRRWLCHGFMAIKDTIRNISSNSSGGERLSHAVGCAFSVCLEKKQKRERENVSMELGPNHSFTRFGSFRQASLSERLEDPQIVIPAINQIPIKKVDNPFAIERPKGNVDILNRQNSLRASTSSASAAAIQSTNPFKRNTLGYSSLKMGNELVQSVQTQKLTTMFNKLTTNTPSVAQNTPTQTQAPINTINEIPEELNISSKTQYVTQTSPPPPPLPPLPQHILQNQLSQQQQSSPPQRPQSNLMSQSFTLSNNYNNTNPFPANTFNSPLNLNNFQSAIYPTPQATPNTNYSYYQTQFNHPTMTSNYSTLPTSQNTPLNESFEAKFARLQAAKKQTNPFAEDLAKKYEIKL